MMNIRGDHKTTDNNENEDKVTFLKAGEKQAKEDAGTSTSIGAAPII